MRRELPVKPVSGCGYDRYFHMSAGRAECLIARLLTVMEEEEQPSGSRHRSAERFGFGFFFLSLCLSFFAGGGAGWPDFSDGRRRFFSAMSSWWLLHRVTASTTIPFYYVFVFCSFFFNAKVQQPCTSNKNIFHICFDKSIWERAHWKMFPLEKLTACPVAHCVTVCSVQLDVAASFCNQTRIHKRPRTSEKRFRREFLKSAPAVLCKALIFNL